MSHYPNHSWQSTLNVNLRGTHQRDITHAQLSGCKGGELAGQIRRGRKHHADEVIGGQTIGCQDLGDKFNDSINHLVAIVSL
jgi:hypothetical protein